jgi:hypothetical protein
MNDFATILTRLEEATRTADRGDGATLASLLGAFARGGSPASAAADDRRSFAARVYGAASAAAPEPATRSSGEEHTQRLPDREEFFSALHRAEGSLEDLRALRRRVAWLCHPDRREKAGARQAERLMAEFNAQIDSAIARAPRVKARRESRRASFR